MRKSFKTLLTAGILIVVLAFACACSGSGATMSKGKYKFESVQINGKTVTIPDYPAAPVMPVAPAELPHEPYESKPVVGTAPVESDFVLSGMTEDQKIIARAQFALAKAEHDMLVNEAEAWQAQKDAADAITPQQRAANTAEWATYAARDIAYGELMEAWYTICQNLTFSACKAAGLTAYVADNVSGGYSLFAILKTIEIGVDGNVITFKNFDMVNRLVNGLLSAAGPSIALEFVELSYELNSNNEIILSIGAPGMRVGASTSALTYKDGRINFAISIEGEFDMQISFKK